MLDNELNLIKLNKNWTKRKMFLPCELFTLLTLDILSDCKLKKTIDINVENLKELYPEAYLRREFVTGLKFLQKKEIITYKNIKRVSYIINFNENFKFPKKEFIYIEKNKIQKILEQSSDFHTLLAILYCICISMSYSKYLGKWQNKLCTITTKKINSIISISHSTTKNALSKLIDMNLLYRSDKVLKYYVPIYIYSDPSDSYLCDEFAERFGSDYSYDAENGKYVGEASENFIEWKKAREEKLNAGEELLDDGPYIYNKLKRLYKNEYELEEDEYIPYDCYEPYENDPEFMKALNLAIESGSL